MIRLAFATINGAALRLTEARVSHPPSKIDDMGRDVASCIRRPSTLVLTAHQRPPKEWDEALISMRPVLLDITMEDVGKAMPTIASRVKTEGQLQQIIETERIQIGTANRYTYEIHALYYPEETASPFPTIPT